MRNQLEKQTSQISQVLMPKLSLAITFQNQNGQSREPKKIRVIRILSMCVLPQAQISQSRMHKRTLTMTSTALRVEIAYR